MIAAEMPPFVACLGQELVGGGRPPTAALVGGEGGEGGGHVPAGEDGVNDAPGGFDAVAAGEEGGVAVEGV